MSQISKSILLKTLFTDGPKSLRNNVKHKMVNKFWHHHLLVFNKNQSVCKHSLSILEPRFLLLISNMMTLVQVATHLKQTGQIHLQTLIQSIAQLQNVKLKNWKMENL